jgi:hypothetical protein
VYVNNSNISPSQDLLDKCYQVLIPDHQEPLWKMKRWAKTYCQSFVWMELIDTTDVSYRYDSVTAFYFGDEQDKLMFMLKYST